MQIKDLYFQNTSKTTLLGAKNLLVEISLLFIIYFLTAKFGLSVDPVNGFATLVWLPSGISLAALLMFGFKLWPAITLGAFLANLVSGAPVISALGIAIGNTLEALVGAYLLKNFFLFRNSLENLRDILALAIVASFSTMISATIGVASLWLGGVLHPAAFDSTWLAWWVGDTISNLLVAPLLLVWTNKPNLAKNPKKILEGGIIALLLLIVYLIVFSNSFGVRIENKVSAYMVFPALIWTALRFGQRGAVTASFILSVITTISTLNGVGPFATSATSENLLFLQAFMAVTSITTMILAAVISERKQSERIKDEFISIAAHELKTPITTIKGYAQLLDQNFKKSRNHKARLYVSKMNTQIDNLTRLISDFFDASKIEASKLELQKELLNIDDLVAEIVDDIQQLSSKHTITIIGATSKQVFADKYRISQVVINLLLNAIKFSPKSNNITVFLSANRASIRTSIQDFGIGISRTDLDNIFKRFFQAKTHIRQSVAGLGLGLYISSEIVKLHGGRIWAKSQKGKGSIFSFTLPISKKI